MNTKLLMATSSVFMALIGIALLFVPNEVLEIFGQLPNQTVTLMLQVAGALYFGFAMTNWMAKAVLIGGIFSRPLCVGNFYHFLIGGLTLAKSSLYNNTSASYIVVFAIIYVLFAILFGYVLFTNPKKSK